MLSLSRRKTLNDTAQVTIEKNKPFSQSKIWQAQREFYDKKGIEAWADDVPFYITSNPFIANSYAQIIIRFIQDWYRKYPECKKHPFYIIELGTGSGQFSFYVMKKIFELRDELNLNDISIQYIMTDFTRKNLAFWENHHALKPFLEKNWLDFAVFDLENDTKITLLESNVTLQKDSIKNPLIVFANYIFDTIVTDIFTIEKNKIYESLVELKTFNKNIKNNEPLNWKKVKIGHKHNIISKQYYGNKEIDTILNEYQQKLKDTHLLFPIGGLRCIQHLNQMSQNKLLLISSDKGYTTLPELEDLDYPFLDFHGSFSVMVNFHAISRYFEMHGGDSTYQTCRDSLTTAVFASGIQFENLPETKIILKQTIEGFTAADYFVFYEHFEKVYKNTKLNVLFSFLCLSGWDPFIFDSIASRIVELLDDADEQQIEYLTSNIQKIADNFYYVPECEDIFFSIGLLLYELDHFEEALKYYKKSEEFFGTGFESFFNIGLCYFYLEKYESSLQYLEQALTLKPRSKQIISLIKSAKKKLGTS